MSKQKAKSGCCQKATELQGSSCFSGAGRSRHHLWKDPESPKGPSQSDRASRVVGLENRQTQSVATRIGSPKPGTRGGPVARGRNGRESLREGGLPVTLSWGGRRPDREHKLLCTRLKASPVAGRRPQTETFGGLCPAVASWAGDAQYLFFCPSQEIPLRSVLERGLEG